MKTTEVYIGLLVLLFDNYSEIIERLALLVAC